MTSSNIDMTFFTLGLWFEAEIAKRYFRGWSLEFRALGFNLGVWRDDCLNIKGHDQSTALIVSLSKAVAFLLSDLAVVN